MTNWYVDNTASGGNDGTSWTNAWESFADIVWASLGAGDTLWISGGAASKTYSELLSVAKGGSEGNPLYIKPGEDTGHTGTVVIDGGSYARNGITIGSVDYVTVDGGTSRRIQTDGVIYCVYASYRTGIVTRYLYSSDSNSTLYCAIRLTGCTKSMIEHCLIRGAVSGGVSISPPAATALGDSIIRYNDIECDSYDGITAGSGCDIYGNKVVKTSSETASHPDGITWVGNNCRVYLNEVVGFCQCIYPDMLAENGTTYIWGNLVYRGTRGVAQVDYHGIIMHGEAKILSAYVYNNFVYGAYVRCVSSIGTMVVKNNLIDRGFTNEGTTGTPSYDIDHNYYITGDNFHWNGSLYGSLALFQAASSQDANSVQGDPKIHDAGSEEWWLDSDSPCIDTGIDLGTDYQLGLSTAAVFPNPATVHRPQGAAWDIGAYEYNSGIGAKFVMVFK